MTQQATAVPYGAQEIIDTRMIGKRPADMVLVSLVGPLRELNHVVVAKPGRSYDWRFLARLEVLIVASTAIDRGAVKRVVDAVLPHKPGYLGVWFADKQDGLHVAFGCWRLQSGRGMGEHDLKAFAGIGAGKDGANGR